MFDLPPYPPGLQNLWLDARRLLADVSFAWPSLLWLSLTPAALAIVGWLAARRQRSAIAAVGRPPAVFGLLTGPRRGGRLGHVALFVAWTLLAVGAAGPRWGRGDGDGVAVGRDVVVVLDLSRSMLATDMAGPPARWQVAILAAADLFDTLHTRGGHRAALVVFAARPILVVPLTTDTDHLRAKLRELTAELPPPGVRPDAGAKSGTRFGAAIRAAVEAHDPRFPGYQDVILISDGDDPIDDREWVSGVSAARQASIPVHTVGVGDPDRASPLVVRGELLEFPKGGVPDPVQTRLHEDVLTAIATEGHGLYLPARREVPRLGEFYRTRVEPNPSRELADGVLPQPRDRSAWFLGFGVLFLAVGWWKER